MIGLYKFFTSILVACAISIFFGPVAFAQKISSVAVTATGIGSSEDVAITRALVRAISQVNGESIASATKLSTLTEETASSNTDGSVSGGFSKKESLERAIENKVKGVVKSWRKVSQRSMKSGEVEVVVNAEIFVLQRSKQLDRLKIAVVGGVRSNTEFGKLVLNYLTDDLVKSRKFAVMDRKNAVAIEEQLTRIKSGGGAIEDQVRISAELAPDLLAILSTELVGKGTPRQRVTVSMEVVDYASRQIKFSERKSRLVKPDSYSRIDMMARGVAKGIYRTVIHTAFPPLVVGATGSEITIAQGSYYFSRGDRLTLVRLGDAVRDPHTGEFLSHTRSNLGEAEVIYTDLRISQAKLIGSSSLDPGLVASGKVQVTRVGQELGSLFFLGDDDGASDIKSKPGSKSKGIFITGDNDDD